MTTSQQTDSSSDSSPKRNTNNFLRTWNLGLIMCHTQVRFRCREWKTFNWIFCSFSIFVSSTPPRAAERSREECAGRSDPQNKSCFLEPKWQRAWIQVKDHWLIQGLFWNRLKYTLVQMALTSLRNTKEGNLNPKIPFTDQKSCILI